MSKTVKRMTGRRLQARRERWFRRAPLCVHCQREGRITAATELDHIIALDNGGPDIESNLQGLCGECHEIKTSKDLGYVERHGAEASGLPASPQHHWNRGGSAAMTSLERQVDEVEGNAGSGRPATP